MKKKLEEFFSKEGFSASPLYRTCQRDFGKESPDNLLPYRVRKEEDGLRPIKNCFRVFIDYNNFVIDDDNIYQIVAYKEEDYMNLPLLKTVHVNSGKNRNKVDLDLVPEKYVFKSIKDLFDNYKRLL